MGLTYLDLQVENPAASDTSESVRALIDGGAIYSAISTATLERLDTEPPRRRTAPARAKCG